jgi:gluconolactonase
MFFAPPARIETSVFASYPKEWQSAKPDNEWCNTQPIAASRHKSLLEGPSFDRDGNLFCVDIPNGRILKVTPDGSFSIFLEYDGWPTGLKFHKDGRIFIADGKHGIMVLDPATKKVEPYLVRAGLERFKGVNDLFFAANGDLWFTDQGVSGHQDPSGRLFRVRANGVIDCVLAGIPSPNGLVMNLDEDVMFLAVTRANAIWRVPLMRNGTTTKVGTYIQLSGGGGPDGLALDSQGRLFIAHIGFGIIWVMDAAGMPVHRIDAASGHHATNIAFGGPERKTLYITESSGAKILTAELDVAGKKMFGEQ